MTGAAGIVLAAGIGVLSALCGISFIDGTAMLHHWLGVAPNFSGKSTQNLWILAVAPIIAGLLCVLAKNRIKIYFLGLADTMLEACCDSKKPFLRQNDTLLVAMQKSANFTGERMAVVTDDGVLVGTLTESDLLRARAYIMSLLRKEAI
ncbi:CBS domain-containing protein [Candidatus Persebacteraceae bacterium Df01]|uniref:CBS domain-containing protein n=1 Tax=Candidatus Doriopsillibacter californiensis TaxID=2970740 RepID=A0ABT7QM31_9GAMM|nr:CBS domain-containing protein [Candidatus Persebacteraceae bacterium Df01]